jgi:hypothetical protein
MNSHGESRPSYVGLGVIRDRRGQRKRPTHFRSVPRSGRSPNENRKRPSLSMIGGHEAPSVVSTGGVGIGSPHARRDARSCARTWCSTRVERGGRGRWPGVCLGTVERVDHEPDLNAAFPLRSALRCNKGNKPPWTSLGLGPGLRTGILTGESRAKVCGQRAVSRGWSSITGKDAPLSNGSWRAHCRILIFAPSVPFCLHGGNHESPTWVSLLRVGQLGISALCRPYES